MKSLVILIGLIVNLAMPLSAQEDHGPPAPPPAAEKSSVLDDLSMPLKLVLVLTALTLLPAILMTVTAFTRIVIVLSFVRRALSVPELPPNQVLMGISIFLTIVVMNPVLRTVNEEALQPYLSEKLSFAQALDRAGTELATFLRGQAREEDVVAMLDVTGQEAPASDEDLSLTILVPAFALSELRTAFQMGFLIFLPFLIVDLVVSSVLLSMGMFMLPPVIISTPFKILLFVLVDGWELVVKSLVESFQAA